ncbi:type III-B CRISPR module RAMP protein Cmr4 [Vibrio sp. WXL210]|uniref:type III-B CRISPR module RAMP protein Cmr4 n=1 Tax=Vibrio sp. WXL210 TaxID=3450709 RepID=UPI003EC54A8D
MSKIQHKLVGLISQTSIHVCASSSDNLIDLPIQREAHTDWPVIAGSGMKGAWRSAAQTNSDLASNEVITIFGPDTQNASDHAGAVMVSDARLVLLPVRSLTSHFKWVTCPALINRYVRDRQRLGFKLDKALDLKVTAQKALVATDIESDTLYLEEYRFSPECADLSALLDLLVELVGEDYRDELQANLTIISNDHFNYLCRAAIPLQARIAINSQTKVVVDGALWYEESLPPETIMYNCLSFSSGRGRLTMAAEQVSDLFDKHLISSRNYLQVGGNTTVGMGWFSTHPVMER